MKLDRMVVPFATKTVGESDGTFEGYGSVFGVLDSYADVVAKGAFKRTLKEAKQRGVAPALLWQHDPSMPVGVYSDMREDDTGLYVKGQLADTQQGQDAYKLLKMGALSGLSIGFRTLKSKLDEESGIRTLTEVELWEVSLVTFPANDAARITGVKSEGELLTEREFERFLRREGGLTEAQAKTVISKGFRQVRREAMPSEDAFGELLAALKARQDIFTGEQRS
jgi:HK97 family phage prohead protease